MRSMAVMAITLRLSRSSRTYLTKVPRRRVISMSPISCRRSYTRLTVPQDRCICSAISRTVGSWVPVGSTPLRISALI